MEHGVYKQWHHAPPHLFEAEAVYMLTGATPYKNLLFDTPGKLDLLQGALLGEAERFGWRVEAWAVFANHYHLVTHAPEDAKSLKAMLKAVHSKTAIALNKLDGVSGRKVWYQYWDTCLTYPKGYMARLHYVLANPVKHGLVKDAAAYRWCSMSGFLQNAPTSFRGTVLSFKIDKLSVYDDF